ncbi:MAG: hypothetical protein V3T08_09945 [Gemmatimonadota bacterium]
MDNHPGNRQKQIDAVRRAGVDPKVGEWPGDPDFEATGPSVLRRIATQCSDAVRTTVIISIHAGVQALNVYLAEAARCGLAVVVTPALDDKDPGAQVRAVRLHAKVVKP